MRKSEARQELVRHNEVYKGINKARQTVTRKDEARFTRMEDNMARLSKSVHMKAPPDAIRHYAALVRHDAEALGIMIRLEA
jgi:hypothetical protein